MRSLLNVELGETIFELYTTNFSLIHKVFIEFVLYFDRLMSNDLLKYTSLDNHFEFQLLFQIICFPQPI